MIRVVLPYHLRILAQVGKEVELSVEPPTLTAVLDTLERTYPALRGTIRDHTTKERRPLMRFFAEGKDLSNRPAEESLPDSVVQGTQPLWIIGAIGGG